MQLTLQENVSEAEDEEDPSDFMETGYKLRDELLPPVLSPEQSQSMSSLKKAKTLQKMFDDQIQKLSINKLLTAILDRTAGLPRVREKSGKNKIFSRSGNCQGILKKCQGILSI